MKALEILKEYIAKLCMSFNGVWISQEELDEAAKELEKIFKENSEDRLAELEKVILDYYLAKGYQIGVGDWRFSVQINSDYKDKNIEVFFSDKQNNEKEFDSVVTIMEETTKKMFDKAFEYFSIKE